MAFSGLVLYRMVQAKSVTQTRTGTEKKEPPSQENQAVEHGDVASPEELHAHGNLYFVAIGRQAIPVESLADYYRQKFQIKITVLPALELSPSACVPERHQCIAEEIMAAMVSAYPEIARNPASAMIALTDEDIFPRQFDWDFTYSLHSSRIGVVSSRRMDPAFWGKPPDENYQLAATKQMLTKYIALEYFHLAESHDPTSVMVSPLTPDGGADDIYESDVHPEASANGQRIGQSPCLTFKYSYKTHQLTAEQPLLSDCEYRNAVSTTDEEIFESSLAVGQLMQRSMDIELNSTPAIVVKRGYNSSWATWSAAFGWGSTHSYNSWLASDGESSLSFMNIGHEDGFFEHFDRVPAGRGFDPNAVYENHDDIYRSRLMWDKNYYKVQYHNGDVARYLPCTGSALCYLFGYQDAKGNSLTFDRGPAQELLKLMASDQQGVTFEADDKHRTTKITATDGKSVSYEYDEAGCLASVTRLDGQITLYKYDYLHHLQSVSVMRRPGAEPEQIMAFTYELGRVVKLTAASLGTYEVQYGKPITQPAPRFKVITPEGEAIDVAIEQEISTARSANIRFPFKKP
jgi:YD repeat-containing protein